MKMSEETLSRLTSSPEEKKVEDYDPPAVQGGVSTSSENIAEFKERGSTLLGDLGSAINIAIGETSFNLDDIISGGLNVGKDILAGDTEDLWGSFEEGQLEAKDLEATNRARLGTGQSLVADLVGNLAGGPKALSKLMDKDKVFDTGGGLKKLFASLGQEGKKGATDEIIRSFLDADSAGNIGLNALAGGAGGAVGQLVLGEGLPRLVKYGVMGLKPAARVGTDFYNQGGKRDGLTADAIRAQYKNIEEQNLSILDVAPEGANVEDAANRLSNLVAKTNFLRKGDEPFNVGAFDEYAETMGKVQGFLAEANKKRLRHVTDTLGIPKSKYYRYVNGSTPELEQAKQTYKSLTASDPRRAGGKAVSYAKAADRLEEDLVRLTDSGTITGLPDEYADAYNMAMLAMRPRVQHSRAKTTQMGTSGDPDRMARGGGQDTDIDLNAVDTTVSRLLAARQQLMKSVNPGAVIRGESEKALNAKVARDVAKLLDAQIEETLGSADYANSRTYYAKYMKTQDANDIGNHFYHNSADPDFSKSMTEYRGSLDADERAAFDAGWLDQFLLAMETDGIDQTIANKIGNVDFRADSFDVTKIKSAGWDQLVEVLGKDKATAFIREAQDNTAKATAIKETAAYLNRKGYDPDAISAVTRDGDELLMAAGFGPGQNAVLANATIASMQRAVAQYGPEEAKFATQLMGAEGKSLVDMLETMELANTMPDSFRGGSPYLTTGAARNIYTEEDDPKGPNERERLRKETQGFLDQFTPPDE